MTKPICNGVTTYFSDKHRDWCKGFVPTGNRRLRIDFALSAMRARAIPECDSLATIADALLARGDLHLFLHYPTEQYGGFAPLGGGATGQWSYMALDNKWVDIHDSPERADKGGAFPRHLQNILAHELDHLLGYRHLTGPDGRDTDETPHQRLCGNPV